MATDTTTPDAEALAEIYAARQKSQKAWFAWDQAKIAAKDAKAEYDATVEELMDLIDLHREGRPPVPFGDEARP